MLRPEQMGYLRELRPHIKASLWVLALGAVMGILSAAHFFTIDNRFSESLRSFTQVFTGLPKPLLALAIFLNNAIKTLLVLILGIVGGVLPVCFLLLNGYALGFVLYLSFQSKGLVSSLLAIVPHGIFELPAVVLGASTGILIGVRATRRLFSKRDTTLKSELRRGLRFFWSIVLPLLLFAAFVEAFITSALVSK
jgi:stage II sporulation protein M